eukprot:153922_1
MMKKKEEKKEENNEINWIKLNNPKIETISNKFYSLNMSNNLKYNSKYLFKIEYMIENPLNIIIKSNVKTINININNTLHFVDIEKQIQIPLKIHSHNGHAGDNHKPDNMFNSDNNKYYASKSGQANNDWIIFEIKDNNIYYPTKLQIKGTNWNG